MSGLPTLNDLITVHDFEQAARAILPENALGYYASGAWDEWTLRENRAAFERLTLHYRVLVDVSARDLTTTVLGHPIALPVLVAPTAFHAMATPDGEAATARAAGAAGTIMILSTLSNVAIEDVTAAATGPVFFQLYVYKDRSATRDLIQRAEAAGCGALVVTVDAPFLGRRERDVRNRFTLPPGLQLRNMLPHGMADLPHDVADSGLAAYFATLIDPSLTWDNLTWLRAQTTLPVIVKGVVRSDDATRAFDHGAAGIVVSNHGGRQLDYAPATITVLPEIVAAVGGRGPILLDGGVRRGTDVVKAIALGATAVLIGRPILWGLAVGGEAGARQTLSILRDEIDMTLALLGCPNVRDLSSDYVRAAPR